MAGSSRWWRLPRRRPTASGSATARCSASSRPPRRRSAPTATGAGSPPTVSGTSASTRCAASTCAGRCAAARRTRSSRRSSRAAGARAPIAEPRSGWRWPAARRSSRSAASSAIRISRCTREAVEVSAGAGHPGGEPFKADVRERGAGEQVADRRLFMLLQVFGGCTDPKPLVSALEGSRLAAVLYQDVNDPRGVGVLALSEDPTAFVGAYRDLLNAEPFAGLPQRRELTMLGRTYASGFEQDLEEWLFLRPRRTVLNPAWPWAIWYPLRRTGAFGRLSPKEQGEIIREHSMLRRAERPPGGMTMRTRAIALVVLALVLAALLPATAAEPVKVVYHLNEGVEQAGRALTNIRHHLSADPTARIVVVAHGRGVDFLLTEAKTPAGTAFVTDIDELALRGVEFRVCRFTLERRSIDATRVVPDAKIVPSGVAEVARLQSREHYAYLKP